MMQRAHFILLGSLCTCTRLALVLTNGVALVRGVFAKAEIAVAGVGA